MSSVTSIFGKQEIKEEYKPKYYKGQKLSFSSTLSFNTALNFISFYENLPEVNKYENSFKTSSKFLWEHKEHLSTFLGSSCYDSNWLPPSKGKVNHVPVPITLENESSLFNCLVGDEYLVPEEDVLDLIFDFYVKSFINFYNGNCDFGMTFSDPKIIKRKALESGNQRLLRILNSGSRILGFDSKEIIIARSF